MLEVMMATDTELSPRSDTVAQDRGQLQKKPIAEATPNIEALHTVSNGKSPYSTFTLSQKRFIVFMVAWASFFSSLSANIYFPALNTLARELHVSTALINLTLTTYMITQGLAPTVFGDLADMIGRRPTFIVSFIIYIGANVGLAVQDSYPALLVLRMVQSTGSSGTIAIGNGVVADIASSAERGTYLGFALMGPMAGPALAPVLGGILSQFLGWQAIFWFLVILAGTYLVVCVMFFPETGRNVVGNGSVPPQAWNRSVLNYLKVRKEPKSEEPNELRRTLSREQQRLAQAELARKRKLKVPNPLHTFVILLEKDIALLLFYNSLMFAAFYDITATIPSQFKAIYDFNDLEIGLCYIPFGIGCLLGAVIHGRILDWNYRRMARKAGITVDKKRGDDMRNFPLEHARLGAMWAPLTVGISTYLCYGWVLYRRANLAAPLVLTLVLGYCFVSSSNTISTMVLDLYPQSPATVTAAVNVTRCLMGAAATAVIELMIQGMGVGWCFTFIALVCACATPILSVVMKHGPHWREERRVRLERERETKEAHRHEREARESYELRTNGSQDAEKG